MLALGIVGVLGLFACEGPAGPSGESGPTGPAGLAGQQGTEGMQGEIGAQGLVGLQGAAGPQGDVGAQGDAGHASHLSPDLYTFTMEPFGHWHVQSSKQLLFTVLNTETGEPASVKDLVVQIVRAGSTRVTERSIDAGDIVFQGDGVYTMDYTPTSYAPHAFSARFSDGGQIFASPTWVAEIAKAGEEGIRLDTADNTYVYQIRYYWDPGHAHASDTEPVMLSFEIMRGVQEGTEINWDQPWQNSFDHVIDAEHAEVIVTTADGAVAEDVHPTYKGKGIYEAERLFAVSEVGHDGMDYEVTIRFTDPENEGLVQNTEAFDLHVVSPH